MGLPEGDLAEHPSSSLTIGQQVEDRWTITSIDIYRTGLAILSKYADQDDADPEYVYRRDAVDEAKRAFSCGTYWHAEPNPNSWLGLGTSHRSPPSRGWALSQPSSLTW